MARRLGLIRLQPLTRARVASLGAQGERWLAELPEVLATLTARWGLVLGRPLAGGSASYVVAATTAAGLPAVLKIAVTAEGLAEQIATLARADGRGYARLFAADLDRHALLLEALGEPLERAPGSIEDKLDILAATLQTAWQDAGSVGSGTDPSRTDNAEPGPGPGEDKASSLRRLIADLWPRLGRPCPAHVVATALAYADSLVETPRDELVVVHGDPHPGNLLRVPAPRAGAETGYCFVDPDGFVADRAYDLGVTLRDFSTAVRRFGAPGLRRLCSLTADRTGVDADRIWRWAFVERVSTGLYLSAFGAAVAGRPFLETATLICADNPAG